MKRVRRVLWLEETSEIRVQYICFMQTFLNEALSLSGTKT